MDNPDRLSELASSYFRNNPVTPTPAGLATYLGFSTTKALLKAGGLYLEADEGIDSEGNFIPYDRIVPAAKSSFIIRRALTYIEQVLSTGALNDDINVPFTRFVFESRLDISPKIAAAASSSANAVSVNGVTINILGVSATASTTGPDGAVIDAAPLDESLIGTPDAPGPSPSLLCPQDPLSEGSSLPVPDDFPEPLPVRVSITPTDREDMKSAELPDLPPPHPKIVPKSLEEVEDFPEYRKPDAVLRTAPPDVPELTPLNVLEGLL